jgi:hypothetical protein
VVAYIAYVDDSGDETTSVYTALLIPIDRWSECLAGWLEFRRRLYGTYGIPADVELHAAEFVHGKGTPAPGVTYGVNTDRAKRRHVLKLASAQIGSMQALTLLARVMPGAKPADCYRRLIADLDDLMVAEGGWCLMVVDGDGTQQYHKPIHRELRLATRRIVEDPGTISTRASRRDAASARRNRERARAGKAKRPGIWRYRTFRRQTLSPAYAVRTSHLQN